MACNNYLFDGLERNGRQKPIMEKVNIDKDTPAPHFGNFEVEVHFKIEQLIFFSGIKRMVHLKSIPQLIETNDVQIILLSSN